MTVADEVLSFIILYSYFIVNRYLSLNDFPVVLIFKRRPSVLPVIFLIKGNCIKEFAVSEKVYCNVSRTSLKAVVIVQPDLMINTTTFDDEEVVEMIYRILESRDFFK